MFKHRRVILFSLVIFLGVLGFSSHASIAFAQTPSLTIPGINQGISLPEPTVAPVPSPGSLEYYLEQVGRPTLTPVTFMRFIIHSAVAKGISANMIVFLLLFPVIASLVAFSRHVIGLTGFSIYAPTALAVVLLSTGIIQGVVLFFMMLAIAVIGKWAIGFLKLEYIPRTAMLLWFVAVGMFLSILLVAISPIPFAFRIEMFPLLILVLLAEDFMGTQTELKWGVALERSFQVMFLAVIGAVIMGDPMVQRFVLVHPELVVLIVGIFNFMVGKYLGLRLTEYLRFKPIIDAEE